MSERRAWRDVFTRVRVRVRGGMAGDANLRGRVSTTVGAQRRRGRDNTFGDQDDTVRGKALRGEVCGSLSECSFKQRG